MGTKSLHSTPPRSVDIVIVTAIEEELLALNNYFDLTSPTPIPTTTKNAYYGTIKCEDGDQSYSVALVCLHKMGNSNAGVDIATVLPVLNPHYIFMLGLAGGIGSEISLADVIVSDQLIYVTPGKKYVDYEQRRPDSISINPNLLELVRTFKLIHKSDNNYNVRFGPFAITEEVVASNVAVDELKAIHPKMVGIEMESYGVALAASKRNKAIEFIAIRGVSDKADEEKNDSSREAALCNAVDFLISFIKSGRLSLQRMLAPLRPKMIAIHHSSLYRNQSQTSTHHALDQETSNYETIELLIEQVEIVAAGKFSEALQVQKNELLKLGKLRETNPEAELAYFGLAHVPLVFHLGYEIGRSPIRLFANRYNDGSWIDLIDKPTSQSVIVEEASTNSSDADAAILMSVSHLISTSDIYRVVSDPAIEIHIRADNPQLGIIDSIDILNKFTDEFRSALGRIKAIGSIQRVHIFYAGPPTLAFRCGQQINKNTDPEIIVYNFSKLDEPKYKWAISLQSELIIQN